MQLWGVDFSSAPSRRKPICCARGCRVGARVRLTAIDELPTLAAFESLLGESGPWLGAFDFPFGLPREFVESQALGEDIRAVIAGVHQRCPTRMAWRAHIDAWGDTRASGQRLIHRRTDTAQSGISSTSPLQTRYVPVGFMFYEGVSRLVRAGVTVAGMLAGDAMRVALEGYPGLLAFELIGRRSYKNRDSAAHRAARAEMLDALQAGRTRARLSLQLEAPLRELLLDDVAGDRLDAVLCLMQAAWAQQQPRWGLPRVVDPVEGWIVGAGADAGLNESMP